MPTARDKMTGYVLPVAMAIIAILTFTMIGVMETAQVEEKQANNEQQRLQVEQVARSELNAQYQIVENNPDWLRDHTASRSLTPTLYPSGCTSSATDAICQHIDLVYAGPLAAPPELNVGEFTGKRFQIRSRAVQHATNAQAETRMALSYAHLELWLRRDLPEALGTNPSRERLAAQLGFFIPEWWQITIKEPWRFACVAPIYVVDFGVFREKLTKAFGQDFVDRHLAFIARCQVDFTDANGKAWRWQSGDLHLGNTDVFVVPYGASNVKFRWLGYVPGRASGHNGFWQWGIIQWWVLQQFEWEFPEPVDFCSIIYGTTEYPETHPCPFNIFANDITPVSDPDNPGGPLQEEGQWCQYTGWEGCHGEWQF